MAKKYSYHYGRVTTTSVGSKLTGPTTEYSKYKGARQAPLKSVRRALVLAKPAEDVVVSVYGQLYPGKEVFEWKAGAVADREQFISDLDVQINKGATSEEAAQALFDWQQLPALILAWDIRPIKS